MKRLIALAAVTLIAGCASTPISVATHKDLQAAAARADANGFPARAAVWRAEDARLGAIEAQVTACGDAIKAWLDAGQQAAPSGFAGVFDAAEAAAEGVAHVNQGMPAAVSANCAPFPPLLLPTLPKIP